MKLKAITMSMMLAGSLCAQESAAELSSNSNTSSTEIESEAPVESSQVEKIEVTGSLIKRVDVEGPSPVRTIDREAIEKAGHNSVGDILRNLSSNSFGSARESSGSSAAGVATVSLKGLGAGNTLVLMNGQRMARDGVMEAPDLNLIPVGAIERIEILNDGASATYGTDALGGVVNVITKKDWNGTEVMVRHEQSEETGGNLSTVSAAYGGTTGKLNSMITIQARNNTKVMAADRDWTRGGESTFAPTSNYQTGTNSTVASPNCPAEARQDGLCIYDYTTSASSIPEIQQANVLTEFNYQMSANTELSLTASGTRKETNWNYAPNAAFFTIQGAFADSLNLPGHTAGDAINVRNRVVQAGTRDTEITTNAFRVSPKWTQYLSDTWEMQVVAGHEEVKRNDLGVGGYLLRDKMEQYSNDGTYNPIDGTGVIPQDAFHQTQTQTRSDVTFSEVKFSGELFDMPAGPMAMAIGGGFIDESYSDRLDEESLNGNVLGSAGAEGAGKRQVNYVFTEFAIPVHETLEMQVSGRFDSYSDFGQTVNPKLAMKYRPNDWLMVRASAGTGFRAPSLQNLYGAASEGNPTFIDHAGCANGVAEACNPMQHTARIDSNQDLTEETSNSYNLGFMVEPNKSFSFGVDLWRLETSNIVDVDIEALTLAEKNGVDLSQFGTDIVRNGAGEILVVETQYQNVSQRNVDGMDLNINSNFDTGIGSFYFGNTLTYLFNFEEARRPGAELEERLKTNQNGIARPQWRNNLSVDYIPTDKLAVNLSFLTTGRFDKAIATEGSINDYTQVDAQVAYALTDSSRITVGGVNVFGTTPNLDDSDPNNRLNASIFDPRGRRYFMAYKQNF